MPLTRWVVAGPEIVRILHEFEAQVLLVSESKNDMKHHEQTPAIQKRYMNEVTKLVQVFEDFEHGNPFTETTANDLLALDTMHRTVKAAHDIGLSQLQKIKGSISIHDPLPRNKLSLFAFKPQSQNHDPHRLKVTELNADCQLFSRLYIACQTHNGDLDEFFRYEDQRFPPSLSQHGTLRFGTKSDLLVC